MGEAADEIWEQGDPYDAYDDSIDSASYHCVECLLETELAIFVTGLEGGDCWIPKSQLRKSQVNRLGDKGILRISKWLAQQVGLEL